MTGVELFRVPCDLSTSAFRKELAAVCPAMSPNSYVVGDVLHHSFTDRNTGQSVVVSEVPDSLFAEVDGDLGVWLLVQQVALRLCHRGTVPAFPARQRRQASVATAGPHPMSWTETASSRAWRPRTTPR